MLQPWQKVLSEDKSLLPLLGSVTLEPLPLQANLCLRLCCSIMSQQLSTKVAAVIYQRFLNLFEGGEPTPAHIAALPHDRLRSIGLSTAKATYVHNVAQHFLTHSITDEKLAGMPDEAVIRCLTEIKGVGRWTAEMVLMFSLGREDVFAVDDGGLAQGMIALYGIDPIDKKQLKQRMQAIAANWQPYRTYGCRLVWRHKDMMSKL